MDIRYIQPYANPQLNSLQQNDLKASGNLGWKFVFNKDDLAGKARFVHVIDEKRAVIDYGGLFFAVDLLSRRALSAPTKSPNTFIRLGDGQLMYVFSGYQLVPLEFDRILSDRLGMEAEDAEDEAEGADSTGPARKRYYVPGLGDYSILYCLYPDSNNFIAGIQGTGNPKFPQLYFSLYDMPYGAQETAWDWGFDGAAVRPPVSPQGQVVVCRQDTITVFDRAGATAGEIKGEFLPVSCSIGPDNLAYILFAGDGGTTLRSYTLWGNIDNEMAGVISDVLQPPAVDADGAIYLVNGSQLAAYRNGQAAWSYPVLSGSPAVTIAKNGRILIADGIRIVCLDRAGKEVWTYTDPDGDVYVTPPVIDQNGNVLAASDDKLLMLR